MSLELTNPEDDRHLGSVRVKVDSSTIELPEFAERSIREPDGCYPASVGALLFENSAVVLIGLYCVFRVTRTGVVEKCFDLFRSPKHDHGFYHFPKLLPTRGRALLKYEGGIACFDLEGQLRWHTKCYWDDFVEGIDDEYVWLSNEHTDDGRPQRISIQDGENKGPAVVP